MLLMEEKATDLVADEDRITVDRVRKVIERGNFKLRRGVFLFKRASGEFTGCACGAVGMELGLAPNLDEVMGVSYIKVLELKSGLPYRYLQGVSDGFERLSFRRCELPVYRQGLEDGNTIREKLLINW